MQENNILGQKGILKKILPQKWVKQINLALSQNLIKQ